MQLLQGISDIDYMVRIKYHPNIHNIATYNQNKLLRLYLSTIAITNTNFIPKNSLAIIYI